MIDPIDPLCRAITYYPQYADELMFVEPHIKEEFKGKVFTPGVPSLIQLNATLTRLTILLEQKLRDL